MEESATLPDHALESPLGAASSEPAVDRAEPI